MKKKVLKKGVAALFIALVMGSTSCTDNQKARSFGGTETVKL